MNKSEAEILAIYLGTTEYQTFEELKKDWFQKAVDQCNKSLHYTPFSFEVKEMFGGLCVALVIDKNLSPKDQSND